MEVAESFSFTTGGARVSRICDIACRDFNASVPMALKQCVDALRYARHARLTSLPASSVPFENHTRSI